MDGKAYCSYYGRLKGKCYGKNLGEWLMDEHYKTMVKNHERQLLVIAERQTRLLKELIHNFSSKEKGLSKLINVLVKNLQFKGIPENRRRELED